MAVVDVWETGNTQLPDMNWHHISHTFSSYATPVLYISYEDWGEDDESWAGFYGSQFDGAYVSLMKNSCP